MKKELEVLKIREVPEHLDARVLAAARLAASGNSRRNRYRHIIVAASGIAAACVAGFAIFAVPVTPKKHITDTQYLALNDFSSIDQEFFALASELNCQSVYALDNSVNLEK